MSPHKVSALWKSAGAELGVPGGEINTDNCVSHLNHPPLLEGPNTSGRMAMNFNFWALQNVPYSYTLTSRTNLHFPSSLFAEEI